MVSVLGYDRLEEKMPTIKLESKINETFSKILWARANLLNRGYSEVMTYVFRDQGEIEVLASASDKKFLRTNLSDGLQESIKLNQANAPILGIDKVRSEVGGVKVFEIGTVFKKGGEEIHVAYGDKKDVTEVSLNDFTKSAEFDVVTDRANNSPAFALGDIRQGTHGSLNSSLGPSRFKMWSLFPFIARDIAVWVPENIKSREIGKIIRENMGDAVTRGPELFDEFKKDGKISYAFRIVFQSYDRTLTDVEVNEIMTKITDKIKKNNGWQVR